MNKINHSLQPLQNSIASVLGCGGVRFYREGDGKGHNDDGKQQQQQQQQTPEDPLKDLDEDLLDEPTRAIIAKARDSYKTTQASLQQLQTHQTEAARLKEELEQTKAQLAARGQQQQQQQKEPTLEEQMAEELRQQGVAENLIPGQAKILAGVMRKGMAPVKDYIDRGNQALAGTLAMREAKQDFIALEYHDDPRVADLFSNHAIKEKVWERVEKMLERGQECSKEQMAHMAKIFAFDMPDQTQQQQTPPPTRGVSTRPTYPHMGNHIRSTPAAAIKTEALNSDTQDAVDRTIEMMKAGAGAPAGQVILTRGGRPITAKK